MTVQAKKEWIELAQRNLKHAYVPYSHFPVSAVLVTEEGDIFTGVNIENASFGLTNCAERTAIFKAISEQKRAFKHFVIAAHTKEPISPCGACRQVMAEFFKEDMPITLVSDTGKVKETSLKELLPYRFTEDQM